MAHRCPTCGRSFEAKRGLGVHHAQVHGEKLPNRTCSHCGSDFHSPHEKKYCSDDCLEAADSYGGTDNGNYRGAKSEAVCELCESTFTYYPSEKPGKFCSDCVEERSWRTRPNVDGEQNPRWKGGKRTITCHECEEEFERHPSELDGEVHFCSIECRSLWLSESFTGEGHPNWTGGSDWNYGPGWAAVRRRALDRDGYACVICGTTRDELGRNPDVHHLLPVRLFAESDRHTVGDAHYLGNVVTLCPGCHRRAEHDRIPETRLRESAGLTG